MSYCAQVRRMLEILDLTEAFDFVASRDDVERGKPDPEIYLLVSRELGISPEECLVIEDSPTGVKAGLAAGMDVVAVELELGRAYQFRDLRDGQDWMNENEADACIHNSYGSDNFMVITDPGFKQYCDERS